MKSGLVSVLTRGMFLAKAMYDSTGDTKELIKYQRLSKRLKNYQRRNLRKLDEEVKDRRKINYKKNTESKWRKKKYDKKNRK